MVQRLFARLAVLHVCDDPCLIAFSGGGDSTALAVAMAESRRAGRQRVWLGHVAHHVRPSAGDDIPVVLHTAQHLSLPLAIRSIPDGAIAAHKGCGLEEAMRRERYTLLAAIARETESSIVLTAHHAGDQAETVLAHVIRGAGPQGAAGMRPTTTLTIPWWRSTRLRHSISLVRPMLLESQHSLRALVEERGLPTVTDDTNDDFDRTRSAIRHRVLPTLDEIHPAATMAIARFAETMRWVQESDTTTINSGSTVVRMTQNTLSTRAVSEQRSDVRRWVHEKTGLTISFERTEAVRGWVLRRGAGRVQLGDGWSILREGRTITTRRDDHTRRADET